jgi:L-ornithine Nalpha-acyltransferase
MLSTGSSPANGRYRALISRLTGDIAAAQTLRTRAFGTIGSDHDQFDDTCDHLLVLDDQSGDLVCCARLLMLQGGNEVAQSYSAQFYDLSALAGFQGRMAELGRFCVDPARNDPDILRVAWAVLTAYVDENNIKMLFGCSSFAGIEAETYLDTFAMLRARHLAPRRWRVRVKAPDVFRYGTGCDRVPDVRRAMRAMPPLLRSYLMMGGWVSDHAVVDRKMNTLHVFTGLEVGAIPAPRKRLLRMAAAGI